MAEQVRYSVEKLNGKNYATWSFKVRLLLIKDDLWEVVRNPMPTPVDASWTKKDEAAQVTIGLLVNDSQLRHIKNVKTARDQWETLQKYHQKATLSNKLVLYKRIFRTVLEEGGDMEEHIARLLEDVDHLAGLGQTLTDDMVASVLLGGLPESYDTLVTALESRPESDLTSDFVKGKLIDEYRRRQGAKDARLCATDEAAMKSVYKQKTSSQNAKTNCFFCRKSGHQKSECFKYKAWKDKKQKANKVTKESDDEYGCYLARSEVCLSAKNTQDQQGSWIIDSGATSHMVQKRSFFGELDPTKKGHVRLADDENRVKVEGVGSAAIKFKDGTGKIAEIKARDALFVPGLGANLLSVRKLTEDGLKLVFEKDICEIIKNGKVLATATVISDLYELRTEKAFTAELENKGCAENCQHIWHKRFGHRYIGAIKELAEGRLATGIQVSNCGRDTVCESCIKGKMARTPFPKESKTETHAALDLVHTDVCGPMQIATPGRKRYILSIIDDFSRYTYLYLMSHKDETAKFIKEYVRMTRTQFNKVPKVIRSDRGREYVNKDLQAYLKDQGIRVQYTAPYSPQQNGVAERKNRSLLDMSRCMLIDSNLDKKYWGEALHAANYLQNRLPSKATLRTPFELWHSKKPDLRHLQIFGSAAYMHIPKEQRRKLDERAEKLIFVGYSEESKAYRLLDIQTNKVKISRDVVFLNKMGTEENITHQEESEVILENGQQQEIRNQEENDSSIESSTEEDINQNSSIDSDSSSIETERIPEDTRHAECRRSERSNRGVPPERYMAALNLTKDESEPRSAKEALSRPDKDCWKKAMDEEIDSLNKNGTWEIVPRPDGRDIVSCKWVFKTKQNADGHVERYKARLVARGFSQKYGTDYDEVFAPVVRQTTFRTLLTIAGHNGMEVKHFDAKTAFLNGHLQETIYMQQPDGYVTQDGQKMVCRLKKGIYGLKQAAKVWNDRLNDCLNEYGLIQSKADLCLYVKQSGSEAIYLIVYVDDFLIAAKDIKKIDEVANFLSKKFQLKDLGSLRYYIGIEVRKNEDGIFCIKQSKYIQTILDRFALQDAKTSNIPLDQGYVKIRDDCSPMPESERYQQLIGALLYLAVNTRPDIAASVTILSQHNKAPTTTDWNEGKRVARYLKGTKDIELRLGKRGAAPTLIGHADADWAENRTDRKSNSGYIFHYSGSPISWACRKQSCVSLSSTEAEYIALAEATQEGIWIRRLLEDFEGKAQEQTLIYEDNQSCLKLLDNKKFSHRTKHIDTKFHFIKDIRDQQLMRYEYCPTAEMVADMLTKPLGKNKLKELAEKCGLMNQRV